MTVAKAYRGTSINEAYKLLQHKVIKKPTYRVTDKQESIGYARSAKRSTSAHKGSIVEADLTFPPEILYEIDPYHIDLLHQPEHPLYQDHVGVYSMDHCNVYLIPPKFQGYITQPKIIEII